MLSMKKNGARDGESKLEARFAALTSGLLARKGQAAPSNAPIADPAEETDPFALEPRHKAKGKAPPDPKSAAKAVKEPPKPAPAAPVKSKPADAPAPAAAKEALSAKPSVAKPAAPTLPQPQAATPRPPAAPTPLKVINERSIDAGYPDNPSPEEIAALEAEADEVLSYFEKFGDSEMLAQEKSAFYGDRKDDDDDVLDSLEDDDPLDALEDEKPAAPQARPAGRGVTAGVTVHLGAREFMRLALGAAEMELSADDLIAEAIEEYLDARGVLSLGGCSCLDAVMKKPGAA